MKTKPFTYFLILFFSVLLPSLSYGQLDDRYFRADELLRQQRYEQAYQKFYQLYQQSPSNFIFLDKTVESLVHIKRYEKAISLTDRALNRQNYKQRAKVLLGEIYHISGDTSRALSIWDEIEKNQSENIQVLRQLARTLTDRGVFDRAISIYQNIRSNYSNPDAITSELAGLYMQAGQYEKAIHEYLQLVKQSPGRLSLVQRRLIRFRDQDIYDVAILEISDFLEQLPENHPSYRNLQQLEVWLLMERNLYKRALVTARNYETQSSQVLYLLYNIGSKLLAARKFKLAEEAYSYYIDQNIYSLKFRAMEEVSKVYRQWAEYLENYNLGLSSKREELYQKAYQTLEQIRDERPNYQRMNKVLIALSELSLDVMHKPEKASEYLAELEKQPDSTIKPQASYIEGRIQLYEKDYTRARISFTKSRKLQRNGTLAEKARYYLALTDFYAGDYEFAKIQLNALERQNTSYFANDAVQLRIWIQEGLQIDSTGKKLAPFSAAIEYFSQGKEQLAINKLQDLLDQKEYHPLKDDAILELSRHKSPETVGFIYRTLGSYLKKGGASSPLHERMLWEKARIADQLINNTKLKITLDTSSSDKNRSKNEKSQMVVNSIPQNTKELIALYEEILLNFPNGFYSTYARERIEELQNKPT